MKFTQSICYLLVASIFFSSCSSSTVIFSTPEADVYVNGKLKGKTPYRHKDFLPTGFGKKIRIEKEGFETVNTKITKLKRIQPKAILGGLFLVAPYLWIGGYSPYYAFNLEPNDGREVEKLNKLEIYDRFKADRGFLTYVGEQNEKHFAYVSSGNLIELDKSFEFINKYKLDFDLGKRIKNPILYMPVDGFITNSAKNVVIGSPRSAYREEATLYGLKVNTSNNAEKIELGKTKFYGGTLNLDYAYGYHRADNSNYFITYTDSTINVFDLEFNRVQKFQSDKKVAEVVITDSNEIISLEISDNQAYLCKRTTDNTENYIKLETDKNAAYAFFRLNAYNNFDKLFVSSFVNKSSEKDDDFLPEGVSIFEVDLNNLTSQSVMNTMFSDTTISKISRKGLDIGKLGDMENLTNRGVLYDGNNIIMNIEKQFEVEVTTTTTSTSNGFTRTKTSSKDVFSSNDIIVINPKKSRQKVISKHSISGWEYGRLGYQSFLKDGKVHFLFNDNVILGTYPILHNVVLDENLKEISHKIVPIFKENKTMLYTLNGFDYSEDKKLLFHKRKKKMGVSILELK